MARRQHGPLTIDEISQGLEVCVDNINALALDAEVLLHDCSQINITDVAASSRGVFTTRAIPNVEGTEAIEVT